MNKSLRAFTLIEILVVVAIIGLLASVLLKGIGNSHEKAQKQTARLFVTTSMRTSLERFKLDTGSYPTSTEGLQALITAPAGGSGSQRWQGPYIEDEGGKVQLDPWGEPYQYRSPGTKNKTKYDLYSKGADKADGTEDDIGNW